MTKEELPYYGDANNQQDVIDRCIAGDESAFKSLYDNHSNVMYNTAYRIVNSQPDAEDLVQDAFLDAFRNISGFENRSAFSTWLKRILIYKCINHLKKKKIIANELKDNYSDSIASEESSYEEEIQWEVNKVLKGIELLPDHYRLVINLYLIEGYDHEEIALITHLPEATVRTQYVRGKKKLVDIIKRF
jgi:RNA polymerase sigma-70 factor (ECF subfamily)